MTPVNKHKMSKGTLASTHLDISFRLFKHSCLAPGGETFSAGEDDILQRVVQRGHKWWLLSCEIPDPDAHEISEWRNSDNNNNQVNHEIEHIRFDASKMGHGRGKRTHTTRRPD